MLVPAALAGLDRRASAPIALLSVGKAASAMAAAFAGGTPAPIRAGAVISTHGAAPPGLAFIESAHPVPDRRSERAAQAALALVRACPADGRFIALISGGASALMALPVEGVSLADKGAAVRRLLEAGADIAALNAVRKHLSAIKGGWLAAASRVPLEAWLLSDVVGDDPSVIGSGPTVPDPSTFEGALGVLDRFGGRPAFPEAVVGHLEAGARGKRPETPKSAADLPRAVTRVIGSAEHARLGAAEHARALGYEVIVRSSPIVGEAREAAREHLRWVRATVGETRSAICVISSGETTVRVTGSGRGGRNQEFALAAAIGVAESPADWTVASVGTDGVDGPTEAAGACADRRTVEAARALGLDPAAYLRDNDSWSFFNRVGGLVTTGPTDTNVGDLQIVLVGS